MRLLKKSITPLKVAFIIAVGLHLALFNFGSSIVKLDNLAHSQGNFSQKVRFKMAAASAEANPSSSADKEEEKEVEEQKETQEEKQEEQKESEDKVEEQKEVEEEPEPKEEEVKEVKKRN